MRGKNITSYNLSNNLNISTSHPGQVNDKILFDNKIWIVVHENGQIFYSNDKCKLELKLSEGDDFSKLKTEPHLQSLINNLNGNNYNNFNFELFVDNSGESKTYNVELERIVIEGEKYYTLIFNSPEESNKLESKISNLHHALEFGEIPVIITDENGKVIYATKTFESLLELDLDVIYNNHISSVLSWYLNNEELANIQASLIKGVAWSTNIYVKNGKQDNLVLDLKLNPVVNEEGNKKSFILTAHDVTYYYQKNMVIKKSEEKQRSIINNISDLLLIFKPQDDDFLFEDANNEFKSTFNLKNSDFTGRSLKRIVPIYFYEKLSTSCNLMRKNKLDAIEFDCNYDGKKHYTAKMSFIPDEVSQGYLYILSLRDITERMMQEVRIKEAYKKEIQMNRLKTTFLQNMSHELRTPATAVIGYSEIIKDCAENNDIEAIQEITHSLENVVNRLINLFNKIIEISEIESDEVEVNRVKLNCNKILKSIYDQKLPEAQNKGVDLSLELGEFHDLIEIDWVKLEKTIHYIVDNAVKFTDYGHAKISSKKIGNEIIINISDTGRGMDQKTIDWLLQPFVQEDEYGLTREYEGSGLGLTIAYKYTKIMGGEIKIQSEKNIGTSVNIIFPIANHRLG